MNSEERENFRIDDDGLSYIMAEIREALKAKDISLLNLQHVIRELNSILVGSREATPPVSELRKKGVWLMSWAFIQIRFICGHPPHAPETVLTTGEQAWVWALAEFSHNIPRVVSPFEDSLPPLSLSVCWVDALERLHKLYEEHRSDIMRYRAKCWTKEKICSAIFKVINRSND